MSLVKQLLAASLCLAMGLLPIASTAFAAEEKTLVKIGVIMPLTGGATERGADILLLLGILDNHFSEKSKLYTYEFIIDDGRCGVGNAATTIAKKFIHVDRINFIITACSGEHLQAAPLAQKAHVLVISMGATHPDVKHIGDYSFRTFVDIERGVKVLAEHIRRNGKRRIALLTEENSFTFAIRDLLQKYLGSLLVYVEDFKAGERDFSTLLTKVRSRKPDGIYFNTMSEATLTSLVNKSRSLGLNQQIYSYLLPPAPSFREATGENSFGLEFIDPPVISKSSEEYQKVETEFLRAKGSKPVLEFFLRTTFDAVKSIVDTVEEVGPNPERAKKYLESYRSFGALGPIEYDERGDIKNLDYVIKKLHKNEIAVLNAEPEK